MELKTYQKNVLDDFRKYLTLIAEKQDMSAAYNALWESKNVMVGMNGMPPYHSAIPYVPHVCLKVPTGGGKTFIASNAIKPIFDSMPQMRSKAVVWLVPSDAILTQTYSALSNADHPYRQKLDVDFSRCVEVYSKAQLLGGQNFTPTTVTEQLSIFVLSYDSFRTSNKEGRKAYQENGSLALFSKIFNDPSILLADTDETALIQIIRHLNPVVIVDESHHATSNLSMEMLNNFNPCFVLDLTATPKKNSNIISFVDAAQLKKEDMVKLPVIVYNRKSQNDVFSDAITIRTKLEAQAKKEQETSRRYIRPIVLFQAQPKNNSDSTTYEKIKKTLIDGGIPQNEIAIKTADKDELKNIDLKSPDCPIRYIITVNALKEGWDCPFAYVLATVANRTSSVDVEQILGRILRLPDTKKNNSNILNMSYVITSSSDFHTTLEKVVKGLNDAGFSSKDYRAKDVDEAITTSTGPSAQQIDLSEAGKQEEEDIPTVDTDALKALVDALQGTPNETLTDIESDELFSTALVQNKEYEAEFSSMEETAINLAPQEVRSKMNTFHINEEFLDNVSALQFPQFMLATGPSLFSEREYELLQLENLTKGFTLKDKDVQIDFSNVNAEMARVDLDDAKEALPKAWKLSGSDSAYFKEWFNSQPSEKRLSYCKGIIQKQISKLNCINDKELREYIDRIIDLLNEDQLSELEQSPFPYIQKIKEKIESLLSLHRANVFNMWLEQDKIICQPHYSLPSTISPTRFTNIIPKALYTFEEDMNDDEKNMVWNLSSLGNIKWWHRNISRLGFQINGYVHAYPDLIIKTTNGRILMVETKGDFLKNDESREKAKVGAKWASVAGNQYRYYMVYKSKQPDYEGAYSYDRFMEIVKEL